MAKETRDNEVVLCPVGRFFLELEKFSGKKSKFLTHMSRSRVEFLKALRALIDEKIEGLEKEGGGGSRKKKKRMTKIEVEQ